MKSFSDHPVQVEFPAGVTIASLPSPMPYNTSLAIDTDGNIWGWGYNEDDELCLSSQILLLPTMLPLTDVTLASGAGDHMLYYSQGQLYACGGNQYGDLGDGTTTSSTTPVLVEGLPDEPVQALVSSWRNSGALMADGTYYDWGYNEAGQLGNGTTAFSTLPVLVPLRATVTDVSLGGSSGSNGQTLAILSDGSIWAWGQGGFGQLGDGLTANALSPVPVTVPVGVVFSRVLSGGSTSYAIDTTGDLWAWGENNFGQLGDGTSGSADAVLPISIGVFLTQVSSTASNVAGLSRPTPTVTVTASPEPATTGPVTYDVTVSGSGATPTGTVSVSDGNGGSCAISSLDSSGSGSCSITEPAGSYTVTATYSGDANYGSAVGTLIEAVEPASPTVSISESANPAALGRVTYKVTVTGVAGFTPTGSVTVSDGRRTCTIATLNTSGIGSCNIAEPAGTYTVTASYSGNANYVSATDTMSETVNKAVPSVVVSASPSPGTAGNVTYSVTVGGETRFERTGSVTVSDGTRTCTMTLSGDSGNCVITEPAGMYAVTATYSGNANYTSATGMTSESVHSARAVWDAIAGRTWDPLGFSAPEARRPE
jgi:alpha-tubulin suppressor-like RCC1 family protein